MLDLARHHNKNPYHQLNTGTKFQVDQFHNPYLTKLTFKIHPKLSQISNTNKFKIYTPLHNHQNITIKQSLPLYKSSKFLFSLNWRQDIRNTYNLTHVGINTTYKFRDYYQLKCRTMVGSSWLNELALKKTIPMNGGQNLVLYGTYNGFRQESGDYYHSVGVGGTYKGINIYIQQKLESDLNFKVNYEGKLGKSLFLRLRSDTQFSTTNNTDTVLEAGIGYYWSQNISAWLKAIIEPQTITQSQIPNMAVQAELKVKNDAYIASVELRQNKSILYLGYKCPSFNLIFPVLGLESPIPAVIAIGAYIVGYYFRKKQTKQKSIRKNPHDRVKELKLISDKANENYNREETQKGLLIEQVYIGPKDLLMEFLNQDNRVLMHHKKYQHKIFDNTVSFRFYVQKGTLSIPAGNKKSMLGCYYNDHSQQSLKIYIRYEKSGSNSHEAMFNEGDQINL